MGFIGSFFGPTEATQKVEVEPDEIAAQLNQIRLGQTQGALSEASLRDFLASPDFLTSLSPRTRELVENIISVGRAPGLSTEEFLDLSGAGVDSVLRRVVEPRLRNQAALSGIGRSGATQEAIANAGAQLLLPILSNLPRTDIALRDASLDRLSQAFQAADIPRQLQVQEFLRRQGITVPLVTGLPFNPGSTTTRFENPFDVFLRRDAQVAENIGSFASIGAGFGGLGAGSGGRIL